MDILCEPSKKYTAPFRRQRQGDIMRHHWLTPCPRPGRVLLPRCDLRDAAQRAGLDLEPSAERAAESWSPLHSKHSQRMLKHFTFENVSKCFGPFEVAPTRFKMVPTCFEMVRRYGKVGKHFQPVMFDAFDAIRC